MPPVPDRSTYVPLLDCWLHTGTNAVDQVNALTRHGPNSTHIAMDIETPGLESFAINCVTAAWIEGDKTHAVLLDPVRAPVPLGHCGAMEALRETASALIFHNAPFDVPRLHHHGLLELIDIRKIVDTAVIARFGLPGYTEQKTLAALAKKYLGMEDNADGMKLAFKARGYKTLAAGWKNADIDMPIYRQGAMLDTVATLRLHPMLRTHAWHWSMDHPFEVYGCTSQPAAEALLEIQEVVHRVMLRRTAVGLAVDRDYLTRYGEKVSQDRVLAEAELAVHGLDGGKGKAPALVRYLDEMGVLPPTWPRTPKGALRATKDDLELIDHPIAKAQRTLSDSEQVMGYLTKVYHQAETTGRCHPQVGTLAASATGRMSYTEPPLQQFNAAARPIIADDGQGLTSIDWSQIEPVTMGVMAKDEGFLAPYEAGEDLYAPLMRAAGIDRDMAKVGLLADMYGQGERGMAMRLGLSMEQAAQIRRQMRAAMRPSARWMAHVQQIAAEFGKTITAAGRILPVDSGGVFRAVNYTVQGSAYDVLAHTICEMDRRGISDHIQLAMHDEVVVDTEVAEEVQQIMTTPPPFFRKWLGRDPLLRTDRADMESSWAKV